MVYEKLLTYNYTLKDSDLDYYFEAKKTQSNTVASWQDYTLYKLKQVYKRILYEAGFIYRDQTIMTISQPVLDPLVTKHIINNENIPFIRTLLGVYDEECSRKIR